MSSAWTVGIGAAATVAGGLLSGGGSTGPSSSEREASARQTQLNDQDGQNVDMARQLAAMYGPEEARRRLAGSIPRDQLNRIFGRKGGPADVAAAQTERDQIAAQLAPYQTGSGNGYRDREALAAGINTKQLAARLAQLDQMIQTGQDPGEPGMLDGDAFDAQGPGLLAGYNNLATQAETDGQAVIDQYGRDTTKLLGASRGVEDLAAQYGRGEEAAINTQYDRQIKGSNRLVQSTMLGRGLGASTTLTNQMSGNTARLEEGRGGALRDLNNRILDRRMGARGDTVRTMGSRMAGGTQLQMGNQDRMLGLKQNALGVQGAVDTGATMNPWSGQGGNYTPALSQGSAQQGGWGDAVSGIGSTLLGYGLRNQAQGNAGNNTPANNRGMGPFPDENYGG